MKETLVNKEINELLSKENRILLGCRVSGKTRVINEALKLNFVDSKVKRILIMLCSEDSKWITYNNLKKDLSKSCYIFSDMKYEGKHVANMKKNDVIVSFVSQHVIPIGERYDCVICDDFSFFSIENQKRIIDVFYDTPIKILTTPNPNKDYNYVVKELANSPKYTVSYFEWFNLPHLNNGLSWVKFDDEYSVVNIPNNIDESLLVELNQVFLKHLYIPTSERIRKMKEIYNEADYKAEIECSI